MTKLHLKKSLSSIKAKVSLLCTGFILIAILVNYLFIINVSKNAITANTQTTMQALADAHSSNITEILRSTNISHNFIMGSDTLSAYIKAGASRNDADIYDLISENLSSDSSVEEISITDSNGIIIYSTNTDLIGTDLSKEAYFSNMMESSQDTQSGVYISSSTGNACVDFASPVRTGMPQLGASDKQNSQGVGSDFIGAVVTAVNVSGLSGSLSELSAGSYTSGYIFVLDSEGNYVYHPDSALIGTKVAAKEITDVVNMAASGKLLEAKVLTFTYNHKKEYAGYSVNSDNGWILFVAADQSEILSSLGSVTAKSLYISLVLIIILTILGYLFAGTITKSIKKITKLINKTAELDFMEDETFTGLTDRNDETGEMSRAIEKMRSILKDMIIRISEASGKITESSDDIFKLSSSVNDHTSDNSATAEELSASMQETAATTDQMNTGIEQITGYSKDINEKSHMGTILSEELKKRAVELMEFTAKTAENTQNIYEAIKSRTDEAISKSKSVERINILANTIKDIAGQTSLLALNASIEAARAGDAGRGFSVVAQEISHLADQSARTVKNINDIVEEVYQAVQSMTASLTLTLKFIDENVKKDYENFLTNSESYNLDADIMNKTMESISKQIEMLNNDVYSISQSISEINIMVNEASKGVNDTAEKNSDIVALTVNTQTKARENSTYANDLKEIVEKFKL